MAQDRSSSPVPPVEDSNICAGRLRDLARSAIPQELAAALGEADRDRAYSAALAATTAAIAAGIAPQEPAATAARRARDDPREAVCAALRASGIDSAPAAAAGELANALATSDDDEDKQAERAASRAQEWRKNGEDKLRAEVRKLRSANPSRLKQWDVGNYFDKSGLPEWLKNGDTAGINNDLALAWVGLAENAAETKASSRLRDFLTAKKNRNNTRNGFPHNAKNESAALAGATGAPLLPEDLQMGNPRPEKGAAAPRLPTGRQKAPAPQECLAEIHASRDIIFQVFARHGAEPKPSANGGYRARFCPECKSERQNAKDPVVLIGDNPTTGRWTWTCQHCHQLGTCVATGDAVEAEKRFRGLGSSPLERKDFRALVNELVGGASAAERSAVAIAPAPQGKKQKTGNSRREWIREILDSGILLSPELLCLLVAASETKCPGNYLDFAALVVKRTGMLPDTARAIARRWHQRDSSFFDRLCGKIGDRERHYFLLDAAGQKVFSPGVRAAEAMLFRCIRGEGKKRAQVAAVTELARIGKCSGITVLRWFGALKEAGIFVGEVVTLADRGRGNGPVVGLQRKLFADDSPAAGALRRIAGAIRDAWKGMVDEVGRRVRWGLRRFIDTVKSLSGAPSAESRSAGGG